MEDDDRTVVRSSYTHRPEFPSESQGEENTANSLPVGTVLGEFEIKGLIGEGGFGIVYLAHDSSLDRMVAIKEFWPASMASRTRAMHVTVRSKRHVDTFKVGLRSFVNEAKLLAGFDSPSLVKVYRFWEANGTAYMVMPFYEGLTLRQALKERQIALDERWLRAMLASVLDAIDTIHRERCYHRDIAPDNIILLRNGRPVLLDFGAARRVIGEVTQSLTVILKPGFAPIEQYAETDGLQQGSWTDIYALAAVAYFIIAGKIPPPSVARIIKDDMVPAREVGRGRYSDKLLMVLDQALAVLPANRIQTVADLRDALELDEHLPRTVPSLSRTPENSADGAPKDGWATELTHAPGTRTSTHNTLGRGEDLGYTDERVHYPERKQGKPKLVIGSVAAAAFLAVAALGYRGMNSLEGTSPDISVAAPLASTEKLGSTANAPGSAATVAVATTPVPTPAVGLATAPLVHSSPAAPSPVPAASPLALEDELWRAATSKDTPAGYEVYLKRYPRGKYASSATALLQSKQPSLAALTALLQSKQPSLATPSVPRPEGSSATAVIPSSKSPIMVPTEISKAAEAKQTPAAVQTVTQPEQKPSTPEPAQKGRAAGVASVLPPQQQTQTVAKEESASPSPRPADATMPVQIAKSTASAESAKRADADKGVSTPEVVSAISPTMPAERERTIKAPDGVLTGSFTLDPATGIASGSGHVVWNNGDRYDGRLVKGAREGKGRFVWANGQSYTGDWSADAPNGRGVIAFANGNRYEGDVRNGVPFGRGLLQFQNGHRYEGEFKGGLSHGQGTLRFKFGDIYTGAWVNGKQHGSGRHTWANGNFWEGEFKDGERTENGKTVFVDSRGVTSPAHEQMTNQPFASSDGSASKESTKASAK